MIEEIEMDLNIMRSFMGSREVSFHTYGKPGYSYHIVTHKRATAFKQLQESTTPELIARHEALLFRYDRTQPDLEEMMAIRSELYCRYCGVTLLDPGHEWLIVDAPTMAKIGLRVP